MSEQQKSGFFRTYDLTKPQKQPKEPAAHQYQALRMLTEDTDVPNVNTVFLTRQTISKILLTQMVGRALRGSKFGGTDEANIISFIDNWQQLINWAEFELEDGGINASNAEVCEPLPMQLISLHGS